jgi:hypothetical protein
MSKKAPADNQMSDKATELVKRALIYADEYSFKEGVSDDMMAVEISIVNKVIDGMVTLYPELTTTLTEQEFTKFKNVFYESIGVGYKIYYAERKYLNGEDDFVKFKGPKFQAYLLKGWEDYFVNNTKDLEPLTPDYVMEAVNYFGTMMFKGGYMDNEAALLKSMAAIGNDGEFLVKANVIGQIKAFILNGYIISKLQDEYRELAGVAPAKKPRLIQ